MTGALDQPILALLAGFGWAVARVLLDGMARGAGSWLFPVLACLSGLWALARPFTEGDPYAVARHVGAIALAAMLLYVPVRVDLVTQGLGEPGGHAAVDPARGAIPMPTHVVDRIGAAVEGAVHQLLVGADQQLLPMLSDALSDAAADGSTFRDDQVVLNAASWQRLAQGLLAAEPGFAAAIDAEGLRDRLLVPMVADAAWSGGEAARARRVLDLLSTARIGSGEIACRQAAVLGDLGEQVGAAAWTAGAQDCAGGPATPVSAGTGAASGLTFAPISAVTRRALAGTSSPASGDRQADAQQASANRVLGRLNAALRTDLDATRFSRWGDAYRAVAAGSLVSAATQLGSDPAWRRLFGAQCLARGELRCQTVLAGAGEAMVHAIDPDRVAPGNEGGLLARATRWATAREPGTGPLAFPAAAVATVVSLFIKLFAQMIAALTPWALAVSRGLAAVVSVAGIYLLLVPGRARDALAWMIGPMIWAHLWATFFLVWYPIEGIAMDALAAVPLVAPMTDALSAQAVMRFVLASGYAALPFLAWKVTFGGLARAMPRMGLDRLAAPARAVLANQIRRLGPRAPTQSRGGVRAPLPRAGSAAAGLPGTRP